jgi:hypothetical protein
MALGMRRIEMNKFYAALVWIALIILYGIAGTMDYANIIG